MINKIKLIAFSVSFFFIISCSEKKEKECCKKDKVKSEEVSENSISNESIFNLESRWVKQSNDSLSLNDLSSKITIAAMIFTNCKSACPRIVADLKRIENSFTTEELETIQFLLISMDPANDTPDRFVEFSNEYQLNEHWICISSNNDATMEIANVLNVRIKPLADGGFDHSNTIHVINKNGIIAYQQNGLAQDPTEILKEIRTLIK